MTKIKVQCLTRDVLVDVSGSVVHFPWVRVCLSDWSFCSRGVSGRVCNGCLLKQSRSLEKFRDWGVQKVAAWVWYGE